ncbi:hypothetical protein CF319_g7112 [Tilletia indica]|nr:hypothetical protein CF319_g7112 [Tilletia indica]
MRVLLLYAGGTIGMVQGPDGAFEPSSGFLTDTLRAQSRFHDPEGSSIFSWSSSTAHYQAWSKANSQPGSGANTPSSSSVQQANLPVSPPRPSSSVQHQNEGRAATSSRLDAVRSSKSSGPSSSSSSASTAGPAFGPSITVKSSAPKATSSRHSISSQMSGDGSHLILNLPTLVTPRTTSGRRVSYSILEYEPLLDSSEMSLSDWTRLAKDIELNYHDFDGFVIVHGTDTAAYTASALSFLLENLGKCVIVTGSQVPLSQLRNDAVENLLGALFLAGNYIIPEVTLFFSSNLYRGSRVSKVSNNALAAFDSPNMKPLARIGISVEVAWDLVARPKGLDKLRVHTTMDSNVAVLRLFPGLSPSTIRAFLAPPLRGCILESYGAGNAPTSAEFLAALKDAGDRGCVIVNTTQCLQGEVSAIYAVGRKLQSIGVVAGGDMTPEAALAKLSYLLAKPELSTAQVRELMGRSLRGELTVRSAPVFAAREIEAGSVSGLLARILGRRPTTNTDDQVPVGKEDEDDDGGKDRDAGPGGLGAMQNEIAAAERVLLPYLIHRAVVQNDTETLRSHLEAYSLLESAPSISITPSHSTQSATSPSLMPSSSPSGTTVGSDVPRSSATVDAPTSAGGAFTEVASSLDSVLPLHTASSLGHVLAVQLLLEQGGLSVHVRDGCGRTPLFHAAWNGHADVVRVLVRAGAHLKLEEKELAEWALGRCEGKENGEERCWREALLASAPAP